MCNPALHTHTLTTDLDGLPCSYTSNQAQNRFMSPKARVEMSVYQSMSILAFIRNWILTGEMMLLHDESFSLFYDIYYFPKQETKQENKKTLKKIKVMRNKASDNE